MANLDDEIMGSGQVVVLRDLGISDDPSGPEMLGHLPRPKGPGAFNIRSFSGGGREARTRVDVVAAEEDLSDDDSILAAASPMALSLIEPLSDEEAGVKSAEAVSSARADGVAWGIRAIGADRSELSGEGVTVAVLDTGIDRKHPAFDDDALEIIEKDFTVDRTDPATGRQDYPSTAPDTNGHGTHCAATIFGRDVDAVRIGVAPGVKRVLIGKVIGGKAGTANLLDALEWALSSGANVISMSLGFDHVRYFSWLKQKGMSPPAAVSQTLNVHRDNIRMFDATMAQFATMAVGLGRNAIVIAASGNESRRPQYRISKSSPSAALGIVSVGAVGKEADGYSVAPFSNAHPDLVGPGVGIVSAGIHGDKLEAMNGTSMACPHIAGLAALYWQSLSGQLQVTAGLVKAQLDTTSVQTRKDFFPGMNAVDIGTGMPWV